MTVAELVAALQQMPQDAVVVFNNVWHDEIVPLNNVQLESNFDEQQVELF